MRARENPPDREAAGRISTTRCGPAPPRCGPTTPSLVHPRKPWCGVHGVRQRHRRRHVRPHARHGPLDDGPRLAAARWRRRAASMSIARAGPTSRTRNRRRSTSATSPSTGSIAPGEPRPIRHIRGEATFYGDRGTLKASVHRYDFTPFGAGQSDHQGSSHRAERFHRRPDRARHRDVTSPRRFAGTDRTSCGRSRTTPEPVADIEQGHISTASCILANMSQRFGPDIDVGRTAKHHRRR